MEPEYLTEAKQYTTEKYNALRDLLFKHNFNWNDPDVIEAEYNYTIARRHVQEAWQRYYSESNQP